MENKSPYLPKIVKIKKVKQETEDIKTFTLDYKPIFKPGQFFEIGINGIGEAPFTAASASKKHFQASIKRTGKLTEAIHQLKAGDKLTIRGPYGNSFPIEKIKGKNMLFIGGGIGLPPLHSLIRTVLENRGRYGKITVFYGARDEAQIVSREELKNIWPKMKNFRVVVCVDFKKNKGEWPHNVGLVTGIMEKELKHPFTRNKNTIVFVCGPPIMIKAVIQKLLEHGFKEENIILTLERLMKCGFGKCGHCNVGEKYICLDGPVFSYKEIKEFEEEF